MPVSNVNLNAPTDYALEQQKVLRQQKLADALQQQALQSSGTEFAPGGMAIKKSPLEGVAKLAQAFAAMKMQQNADSRLSELATQQRGDQSADMSSLIAAMQGTPATTRPQQGPTQDGIPLPDVNMPAQPGSLSNLDPSSLRTPEARQMVIQMMMKQAQKAEEPQKLGPNDKLFQNGRVVAENPYTPPQRLMMVDKGDSIQPTDSLTGVAVGPAIPKGVAPQVQMVNQGDKITPVMTGSQGAQTMPGASLPISVSPNTTFTQKQENKRFGSVSASTKASNDLTKRGQDMANDPLIQGRIAESRGAGTATGTATAQAAMDLPAATAKAEQAVQLVDQMVGSPDGKSKPHPGFQDVVGATWKPGARLVPGTNAAGFQALLDQVKGGAFMQAYDTLKGGGQITEVEGAKATSAITRMNTAQSEKEFTAAAREFQNVIRAGVQRARQKAAGRRASDAPGAVIDFHSLP